MNFNFKILHLSIYLFPSSLIASVHDDLIHIALADFLLGLVIEVKDNYRDAKCEESKNQKSIGNTDNDCVSSRTKSTHEDKCVHQIFFYQILSSIIFIIIRWIFFLRIHFN